MFVPIGGFVALALVLLLAVALVVLYRRFQARLRAAETELARLRYQVEVATTVEEILARAEAQQAGDDPRRRRFRIIPGGLAGLALGAAWAARRVRDHPLVSTAAAAGVTAGAAGLVALPLLLGPEPAPEREAMPDPRPPAVAPAVPLPPPTPDRRPPARRDPALDEPPAIEPAASVPTPTLAVELDAALPPPTGTDGGGLPVGDGETPEAPDLPVDTTDPPDLPLPDLPLPVLPELPVDTPPLPIPAPAPGDEADEGDLLCVEAAVLRLPEVELCVP